MTSPAILLAIMATGCTGEPEELPPTLDIVSEKITYDSVARMGAHHAIASITQTETRSGELVATSTETIEIAWNSWDSFHFQRTLDGESTFEAIVHQGRSASRSSRGAWTAEFDSETARMDVYTAWNAWDEALGVYTGRIEFEALGPDAVDGRPASRFNVHLAPETTPESDAGAKTKGKGKRKRKPKQRGMTPTSLEGKVLLDEETAVRLSADVRGTATQGTVEREVSLKIRRSMFGKVQPIELPPAQLGTAADLLKKLPQRPNPQRR